MKNAKERFYEVLEVLGLSNYKVYTEIDGITKNMMSKLRQGITEEVSVKILAPFCEAYPQVNANYILTGRGGMFIEEKQDGKKIITESQTITMYDNMIRAKDEQIEELKTEITRLESENSVLREIAGIGERKPQKSA